MIARNHVLVHATIHIKGAMVGAVLEDAEEVASMRHDLQVNLEKRLVDMGSSILDLQSVFEDMDADNSGSLSYRELRLAFEVSLVSSSLPPPLRLPSTDVMCRR
jgi:hypothetical protein